jgi:hypothetical protein
MRSRPFLVLAASAAVLLAPRAAQADAPFDPKKVLAALAGKGSLDGVELVRFYATNPEQLACIPEMLPYPTATFPALASMAAARALKVSGAAKTEADCVETLNPLTHLIDPLVDGSLEEGLEQVKNPEVREILILVVGEMGKEAEKEIRHQIDQAVDDASKDGFRSISGVLEGVGLSRESLVPVLLQPSSLVQEAERAAWEREMAELRRRLGDRAVAKAKGPTGMVLGFRVSDQVRQRLKARGTTVIADLTFRFPQAGAFFNGAACACPLAYRTDLSVDRMLELMGKKVGRAIGHLQQEEWGRFVETIGFDLALETVPELACEYGAPGLVAAACKGVVKEAAAPVLDLVRLVKRPSFKNAKQVAYSASGLRLAVNARNAVAADLWSREYDGAIRSYRDQCRDEPCRAAIEAHSGSFRQEGIDWLRAGKDPEALDARYESQIAPTLVEDVAASLERHPPAEAGANGD